MFDTDTGDDLNNTQVPLVLAWAMSIHKSQGQTLERVKVDLARIFEKGQQNISPANIGLTAVYRSGLCSAVPRYLTGGVASTQLRPGEGSSSPRFGAA